MTRLSESAVLAGEILRKWSALSQPSSLMAPGAALADTLEQERHEALEAILQELERRESSPDRIAACRSLLRHLAQTPGPVS